MVEATGNFLELSGYCRRHRSRGPRLFRTYARYNADTFSTDTDKLWAALQIKF